MKKKESLRVIVVGAGMSGILCGIRLQQEGIGSVTIYEKGERAGGTWRENTYPGLSCDIPSHVYSYSFERNPDWSHHFAPGPEILDYLERTAEKYGVTPLVRFGEEVTRCEYDGETWHVETRSGISDEADIVLMASGVLHHLNFPEIDGFEDFSGEIFHSARWNHDFDLRGKRVGIIGTGSTAVQIVGAIVDQVDHLALFQRTAQWVMPQENPEYSQEEKQDFREHPEEMGRLYDELSDLFGRIFANAVIDADSEELKVIEAKCLANLEDNVRDPDLRRRLTPDYRATCKRLVISGEFYDAIQKPNAELVDAGIDRIEERGIRTKDDKLIELDCIVFATGFNAHQFMRPMKVTGRDGKMLDEVWKRTTPAYRSVSLPGFPNFFMLIGPNSPVGNFSLIEVAELQFNYIMQLIDHAIETDCREIEASQAATDTFNSRLLEATKGTIWVTGCRSWYLNADGIPAAWPWTLQRFREEMQKPNFADFELRC
ncbi:MAG: NAD(P)/FAD-dependent oxidoreductase [Deltaproteobacteria bacterium]|nr:NAD(P)/FAD-dependent oxidoreductase [Deltaproteobacteria bacterium]